MTRMTPFEGAMTALVTPFRDGKVDDAALTALVEEQIAAGIDALVPAGTTGESPTLSVAEQVHVIRVVVAAARKRVPVIAGAGANATDEAIELSRAAREVGADGLLHVTPYYNKPTQEGLYRHFEAVVKALETVGGLPIVLYNVPFRTGGDLLPDTVARLAADFPSVVAIKEASGQPIRATQILLRCQVTVLSGDDALTLPYCALGARGVISVLSNIAPKWVADMWDFVKAGDFAAARQIHEKATPLLEALFAETSPQPIKMCMALAGKMSEEIRLPLVPTAGAAREKLGALLGAAGLL